MKRIDSLDNVDLDQVELLDLGLGQGLDRDHEDEVGVEKSLPMLTLDNGLTMPMLPIATMMPLMLRAEVELLTQRVEVVLPEPRS